MTPTATDPRAELVELLAERGHDDPQALAGSVLRVAAAAGISPERVILLARYDLSFSLATGRFLAG